MAPMINHIVESMMSKTTVLTLLPIGAAVLAGALIPIQAASGGSLGRALGHPIWGAAMALFIGTLALLLMAVILRLPAPAMSSAFAGPWWICIGGVTGAIYVGTTLALIPRIGAANLIVCVIAGQMVVALLLDNFGLLGLSVKQITATRAAGVLLMLAGLLVTQVSKASTPASEKEIGSHCPADQ
jgi:transporter family-2 protein